MSEEDGAPNYEPPEYDPEAALGDPDEPGPTIHDPGDEFGTGSGTDPTAELPDPGDAPEHVRRAFWSIVLVLNGAILLLAVGLLFAIFRAEYWRAGLLVGGGVVLLAAAWIRYRRFLVEDDRRRAAGEEPDSGEPSPDEPTRSGAGPEEDNGR